MVTTEAPAAINKRPWHNRLPSPGARLRPRVGLGASVLTTTSSAVASVFSGMLSSFRWRCVCSHCANGTSSALRMTAQREPCRRRAALGHALGTSRYSVSHTATNKGASTNGSRPSSMGSANETQSAWIPETDNHENLGYQVLSVFLGVGFVSCVCVLLAFTVVAGALREMDDWARRKAIAEHELSEVGGLPPLGDSDDFIDDDSSDEQHVDPPYFRSNSV